MPCEDSEIALQNKPGIRNKFCRNLTQLKLISVDHPKTFSQFRSVMAVMAEQQRQLLKGGRYVIHPLSPISFFWNIIIALVNLLHMSLSTFRLCYIIDTPSPCKSHGIDQVLFALHIICLLDIFVKFCTAFSEGFLDNYVIDQRRIAWHYLWFQFWFDLISSLPLAYIFLVCTLSNGRLLLLGHMLPIIRTRLLFSSIKDIHTSINVFSRSYILHRCLHYLILLTVTMHWCNCFIYVPTIFTYYWTGYIPTGYNTFLKGKDKDITQFNISERYFKALFVCLSTFFGTGFSTYEVNNSDEFIIYSIIIVFASMFMVYTIVFLLKMYMTIYHCTMQCEGLMNQVQTYMQQKQFPRPLKRRVSTFYRYMYQERYYNEKVVLDSLSDQLRHEMVLHSCNTFLHKVKVLQGMPANVLGELMSCLKPVTYLANDLVVRAGEIGDCMFFIAYGTVSVYSLKGAEVRHLEDGDHFGTVALLMKDSKRMSTVVAVEITHLYRLDAVHFRDYIMTNKTLRERIETIATHRMHETVLYDEAFRKKQDKKREESALYKGKVIPKTNS